MGAKEIYFFPPGSKLLLEDEGNVEISGSLLVSGSSTTTLIGPVQISGSLNQLGSENAELGTTKVQQLQARDAKVSTIGTRLTPFSKMFLASEIDISGSSTLSIHSDNNPTDVKVSGSFLVSGSSTFTVEGPSVFTGNVTQGSGYDADLGTTKVQNLEARDAKVSTIGTRSTPFAKMFLASEIDVSSSSILSIHSDNNPTDVNITGSMTVSGSDTFTVQGPSVFTGGITQGDTYTTDLGTVRIEALEPRDVKASTLGTRSRPFPKMFLASEIDVSGSSTLSIHSSGSATTLKVTGSMTVSGSDTFTVQGPSVFTGGITQGDTYTTDLGTVKVQNLEPRDVKASTLGTRSRPFPKMFLASTIDVSGSQLIISGSTSDPLEVIISGSIYPMDSGSNSRIGSLHAPFKDLYVQSSSLYLVDPTDNSSETITKAKWKATTDIIDNLTATVTELNKLDGFTGVAADLELAKDLRSAGATNTKWSNLQSGRMDNIATADWKVGGNILPAITAKKGSGYTLGSDALRWSKVFVASTIDVSGSELVISAPSASQAGDDFTVILSGSLVPANTGSDSLGSVSKPFKDLYITTGSIIYIRDGVPAHKLSADDVGRLRDGKPLRATDDLEDNDRVRARLTGGVEITGSLIKDGVEITSTATELNLLDTATAGNVVNSKVAVYGSSGELDATTLKIGGTAITSTATELNKLDGVTATTTELNYVDGVTSNVQTQLGTKLALTGGTLTGPVTERFTAFTDQDTTPSVRNGNRFKTANTRATAIANLDDIADGQEVTIVVNDANTDFTHGARGSAGELRLNGARDWTACAAGDTITFIGMDIDGRGTVVAFEKCRSDNT